MTLDGAEFRRILGHWVSGVSVVTAQAPGEAPCGLTANAFCSVSLEPPLVLVCVEKSADSHDCIARAGAFCVNVLPSDHERIARHFAETEGEKFTGIAFRTERTGAPVLDVALAWVECRLHESYEGGDHTIFLGEVIAGDAHEGAPLLYYRGGYGRFTP
jgi:flavin reductase (DIM6/NTAB) family NADH-FMN oxidoreductase RutF